MKNPFLPENAIIGLFVGLVGLGMMASVFVALHHESSIDAAAAAKAKQPLIMNCRFVRVDGNLKSEDDAIYSATCKGTTKP